jgi:hypothetical protein
MNDFYPLIRAVCLLGFLMTALLVRITYLLTH